MGGTSRIAIQRPRGPSVNQLYGLWLSPLPRPQRSVTSCGSRNTTPAPQRSHPMRFAPSLAAVALVACAAPLAAQATRATAASDGAKRIGCDLCGAGVVLRDPQEVTERCGRGNGLNQRPYNWLTDGPRGRCIAIREVPPIL